MAMYYPLYMAKLDSRAVKRLIPAGIFERCEHCNGLITWETGRRRNYMVICNVYRGEVDARVWDRLEIWDAQCYSEHEPYGPATK